MVTNLDNVTPKKFEVSNMSRLIMVILAGLGTAALIAGFFVDKERAWHAYLTAYCFFVTMALGGLFFTAIHHATSAGWSVNVRRVSESFAAFVPVVVILGLPIVFFARHNLFEWLDPAIVSKDALLQGKAGYLNQTFFAVRFLLFGALWILFGRKIVGPSLRQDEDGQEIWSVRAAKWSVAFLLVFALSFSFFSVDFLMSLQPHWFSTIFGVYVFGGLFQATMALMILVCLFVIKNNLSNGLINIEHVHDLAKYMKAFTIFWAYIAFSQFMLIWYANLPEETIFFLNRADGGWLTISVALLVFRFIVPFLALLPRWAKRTPGHLTAVCILVLAMQYMDLYWIVYPSYSKEHVAFSWMEIGVFLGFAGAFALVVTRFLSSHNLVPSRDPHKHESNAHHVVY